jgi:hypothetical protein
MQTYAKHRLQLYYGAVYIQSLQYDYSLFMLMTFRLAALEAKSIEEWS